MFRKLVPKARQPEYMVGEDGERLCESLHILVPDYELPVTHEQKAFGHPDRFDNKNGCALRNGQGSDCGGKHHRCRCKPLNMPYEMHNIYVVTVILVILCSKVSRERFERTGAR